jgi:hypothetical protein
VLLAVNVLWLLPRLCHLSGESCGVIGKTDELKDSLRQLRTHYVQEDDLPGRLILPYDPYNDKREPRSLQLWHGKGGYAEVIALLNATLRSGSSFGSYCGLLLDLPPLAWPWAARPVLQSQIATAGRSGCGLGRLEVPGEGSQEYLG